MIPEKSRWEERRKGDGEGTAISVLVWCGVGWDDKWIDGRVCVLDAFGGKKGNWRSISFLVEANDVVNSV